MKENKSVMCRVTPKEKAFLETIRLYEFEVELMLEEYSSGSQMQEVMGVFGRNLRKVEKNG